MSEDKKIDHEYTREIVCPYCGQKERDSWEFHDNYGTTECGSCGNHFSYSRDVDVTYNTSKLCKENNQEHQWDEWKWVEPWTSRGAQYEGFWHRNCSVCGQGDVSHINPLEKKEKKKS